MKILKAGYKRVKVQGLECYLPTISEYKNGKKLSCLVLRGDPLVFKRDAIKYAQGELTITLPNDYWQKGERK